MPGTVLVIAAGAVALAGVGWPLISWWEVSKLEKPQYEVLRVVNSKRRGMFDSAPSVEIRRYSPYLIAKVVIDNPNMKEAMGQGFKKVAGFIFGGNTTPGSSKSEKVAMTTPVQSERVPSSGTQSEQVSMTSPVTTEMADGKYVVSFVMPSKYTKESLPKPKDDDVLIEEVPAHVYGALSWRGGPRPTDNVVEEKRQQLLAELDRAGIQADRSANTRLFQYYPPFAPQAIRLTDVLLPVDESSLETDNSQSKSKSS